MESPLLGGGEQPAKALALLYGQEGVGLVGVPGLQGELNPDADIRDRDLRHASDHESFDDVIHGYLSCERASARSGSKREGRIIALDTHRTAQSA
jgi:hypothetical protein